MSTYDKQFRITVSGEEYYVDVSTHGSNDTFTISREGRVYLTRKYGECNPLQSLWEGWKYQSVHGAARDAMEKKCIREAVEHEINAHKESCLDSIDLESLPE